MSGKWGRRASRTRELAECSGGADRFVVVDTETTGVYRTDRIVEIAILTMTLDGEIVDEFDTLVNPERDVSASHIHGITASMVKDAPTFEEIAGDVAVRLHGACFVAHNAPFDNRMLANEYERLGCALRIERSVDTFVGSQERLAGACSRYGIDLAGSHRARTDANATAHLFRRLHRRCGTGAPIGAPARHRPRGRVRRREDTAPVVLPEPPLITYLASRLPFDGLAVRSQQYLEFVGRAVADLHLDATERTELAAIAAQLGLTRPEIAQAHRRYVNELIAAAVEDAVVTDDEYDTVIRIASALDVDQDVVERRVATFRTSTAEARLSPGIQIVFTGDHPELSRASLEELARHLGLQPARSVTRKTGIVCAVDPSSGSRKATSAHRYGIPIIRVEDLINAKPGDVIAGTAVAGTRTVVTCPDCHATRTVPASQRTATRRRCDACTQINSATATSHDGHIAPAWPAPTIEWLTCRRCSTVWPREVSRGRKPHYCHSCSGASVLPAPSAED